MNKNEYGRSMIEMLGVLAIVGVLSVGGISGYSKAMAKYKTDVLINQIGEIVLNIRSLFFGQNDYSKINNKLIFDVGIVPSTMVDADSNSNKEIKHIMGGNIMVMPSKVKNGALHAFELYITSIIDKACISMLTMDWGSDPASGFIALYVGQDTSAESLDSPIMEEIYGPSDAQPDNGIYTSGQSDDAVPVPVAKAIQLCRCSASGCIIGLKYN